MTVKGRKSISFNAQSRSCPFDGLDRSRDLIDLFNHIQTDEVSAGKAVNRLRKLYDSAEKNGRREEFFKNLVRILQVPLVNGTSKDKPNKFDEKLLQVVSKFAAESAANSAITKQHDETNGNVSMNDTLIELPWVLRQIFDWLLDHHGVQSSGARLRICMMINWLLKHLGLQAEIDEQLYQKIYDNMMERLQDKVAEIRAQAVTALQRLQDPSDVHCPIIRAYHQHLKFDPSPLVRRTVIKYIAASKQTLKPVLQRTRDVDETVRRAAYKFLSEKVSFKPLSITVREEILREGLSDRSPSVQKVVSKELIPAWLRICDNNLVEMFHAIDVGNSDGKTAMEIAKVVFTGVPFGQLVDNFKYIDPTSRLVPLNKLTPETVTYWKNLVAFLFEESAKSEQLMAEAEDFMEKVLPELSVFCNYVRDYVTNFMGKMIDADATSDVDEAAAYEVAGYFVVKELIEMTAYFDMSDECGRCNLLRLCKDLLVNRRIHAGFVESIMKIYNNLEKDSDVRIREIAEIISDLRDPLTASQPFQTNSKPVTESMEKKETSPQKVEDGKDEDEELVAALTAKEREEIAKKSQTEARKNEEALRKKRVELAKLRLKLNLLKDDLDKAISNQNFLAAQEIKGQFEETSKEQKQLLDEIETATSVHLTPRESRKPPKVVEQAPPELEPLPPPQVQHQDTPTQTQTQCTPDEPEIILKCLTILGALLRSQDILALGPTLQAMLDEFIVPSVSHTNPKIRETAVKALGCACLRSLRAARQLLLLVLQMAHLDEIDVRLRAIRVVIDLLMWHGLDAFISEGNEIDLEEINGFSQDSASQFRNLTQAELNSQGGGSVVTVLCQLLEDSLPEVRALIAEGICKLMLRGAVNSSEFFTRLVLMWCNPINESNTKMKNILGMFFPLFASLSKENQNLIGKSFIGTMKTLMDAPETSPLAMVNVEDIGLFYVQLTRNSQLQSTCRDGGDASMVHDSLATTISKFIVTSSDSFYVKTFVKFLNCLEVSNTNFRCLRELKELYDQITNVITEKNVLKSLEKYGNRLERYLEMDPERVTAEPSVSETPARVSQDSQDERRVSFGSNVSDQSSNITKAKKRTLYSQALNSVLDVSLAATASPSVFMNKKSFFSSTQRQDNFDLSVFLGSQMQPAAVKETRKRASSRSSPRTSKHSDEEIELQRKVVKQSEERQNDDEVIVSGNLKLAKAAKGVAPPVDVDHDVSRNSDSTDIDFALDFNTPKGDLSVASQGIDLDESVFLPDKNKIKLKPKRGEQSTPRPDDKNIRIGKRQVEETSTPLRQSKRAKNVTPLSARSQRMLNRQDRSFSVEPANPKQSKVAERKEAEKPAKPTKLLVQPVQNVPDKIITENTPVRAKKQSQNIPEQSPKLNRRPRRKLIDEPSKKEATENKPPKVSHPDAAPGVQKNPPPKKDRPVPTKDRPKFSETELKTPDTKASKQKPSDEKFQEQLQLTNQRPRRTPKPTEKAKENSAKKEKDKSRKPSKLPVSDENMSPKAPVSDSPIDFPRPRRNRTSQSLANASFVSLDSNVTANSLNMSGRPKRFLINTTPRHPAPASTSESPARKRTKKN